MYNKSIWNKVDYFSNSQFEKLLTKNIEVKEVEREKMFSHKKDDIMDENEYESIERKNLRFINKKKGRRSKDTIDNSNENGIHDKNSDDNIKRKVKTHYHNFIITFLNMKSKKFLNPKNKFGKISSVITQNITVEFNKKLFYQKIKDIVIQISEKYQNKEKNKKCLQIIYEKANRNEDIFQILNMNYKDMFINCYLKSNKETFKDEPEDESYEAHIEKLENLYGDEYVSNYKRNAESLITFFEQCKKRIRIKKPKLEKQENILNTNYINISNPVDNSTKLVSISTQTEMYQSEDEDEDVVTFGVFCH